MSRYIKIDIEKVKQLKAKGLTDAVIAERLGVTHGALYYHTHEKKERARINTGPKYCDIPRPEQRIIATRRDETTGAMVTVLAGPPERPTPKSKPWCGTH